MTEVSEKIHANPHNIELGIEGFNFSDLFDAGRLKDLADRFYADVEKHEPLLHDALTKYIAARGEGFERRVESKILTDAAPILSDFIARLFKITGENKELEHDITVQNPVWKYKFFVQRRAAKKYKPEQLAELNEGALWIALTQLRNTAFDETLVRDEELSIAEMTCRLLDAEEALGKEQDEIAPSVHDTVARINAAYEKLRDAEFGKAFAEFILQQNVEGDLLVVKSVLSLVEAWSAAAFNRKSKKWHSFKVPHGLDYQNLVHLIHPEPKLHNIMRGSEDILRKRDGFKLTDDRGTMRDALNEIDYCMICHEREKDACRTGLHDKDATVHRNPLGIKT